MKMSKGLEALHRIANAKNHFKYDTLELVDKDFQIVQQELQRLEAIGNANSSEALGCVDYIENKLGGLKYECERTNNHRCDDLFIQEHIFANIKNYILKAQEKEKVLSIINEYQVDIWLLKQCDYENYIRIRKEAMVSIGEIVTEDGIILEDEIPQEEFDTLKRYCDENI